MESLPQFGEITVLQQQLLDNFYNFNDLTKDHLVKTTISNLVEQYRQVLGSIRSELQFRYEIELDSYRLKNSNDEEFVALLVSYSKHDEFLTNFKKNLVKKQYQLKNSYKERFQEEKLARYSYKETEPIEEEAIEESIINSNVSQDAKIMQTTKKITSKLIQSSQILQSSLMQSQLNLEELTIQNDALTDLSDKYTFLKGVLETSDGFINDIKLSKEKDKRKMYYALGFFSLCVLYILYRRFFKFFFNILFYAVKLVLGVFGLISRKHTNDPLVVVDNIQSDFISPTLVDDDEIIYDTIVDESVSTGIVIESAIYDENVSDESTTSQLNRIVDEL